MKRLGTTSAMLGAVRELNTKELRKEAERPPNMVVVAPNRADGETLAAELTGVRMSPYCRVAILGEPVHNLDLAESVVILDPAKGELSRLFAATVRSANPTCVVTNFEGESPLDQQAIRDTRSAILTGLPERVVSFGRFFPVFRPDAVKMVTNETARANAKFAFASNVSSLVPIVGSVATAAADLVFITKNQAMLVYKIAAIHNRDLSDHVGIYQELAPVIGAGFLWRTLAREAVVFLPFAAGMIPKVGIAYSGTIAVGQGADYYFRTGKKPTKDQLVRYYRQSTEMLKTLNIPVVSKRLRDNDLEVNYRLLEDEIS